MTSCCCSTQEDLIREKVENYFNISKRKFLKGKKDISITSSKRNEEIVKRVSTALRDRSVATGLMYKVLCINYGKFGCGSRPCNEFPH